MRSCLPPLLKRRFRPFIDCTASAPIAWQPRSPRVAAEACRLGRLSQGSNGRRPRTVNDGRLVITGPWWHRDANELQVLTAHVPILECGANWDVDRDARKKVD